MKIRPGETSLFLQAFLDWYERTTPRAERQALEQRLAYALSHHDHLAVTEMEGHAIQQAYHLFQLYALDRIGAP